MFTDLLGNQVSVGDYVVYPGRYRRSMRTEMVYGRVIAVKLGRITNWDYKERKQVSTEVPKAHIQVLQRAVDGHSTYRPTAVIENTHNLVKVPKREG